MLSSTSASWKTHLAFTNPLSARSSGVVHGLQNIGAANQVSVCQSFFVAFVSSERHLQIPRNHGNHGRSCQLQECIVEAERCVWCWLFNLMFVRNTLSGWWFQTLFIFHNIWDNPSHWLIFFRGVGQPPTSFVQQLYRSCFANCFYKFNMGPWVFAWGMPIQKTWKFQQVASDVFGENVRCAWAVGTPQVQTNPFPFPRMIDGFWWRWGMLKGIRLRDTNLESHIAWAC